MKFDDIEIIKLVHQLLQELPAISNLVILAAVAFASSELARLTVKQFKRRWVKAAPVAAIDLFAFASGLYIGDTAFAFLCCVIVHVGLVAIVEIRGMAYRMTSERKVMAEKKAVNR
ncbi:membrane hypothetical protein [Burkholderia sp. 8Y]|uniref:hypothetical protein n=1 Tax=Burkholderia sp. 8Y TaxID=2653133 RepID=UPI0012F27495|nr:hypothetical protein [Burkholderia sp. 8Y]VXC77927.1 membrane hypothetical protein [Burkholderia sp. 8Y]